MYASYTGKKSRSLSTTDVYRINHHKYQQNNDAITDEEEEVHPRMAFSTLRRQIRRPSKQPPPVPPKRSDSFYSTSPPPEQPFVSGSTSGVVRSYLSDDIRREFETKVNEAITVKEGRTDNNNSPRTSNFVKNLVATLERRQKDNVVVGKTGLGGCTTTHDIYSRSFKELSRDDRCMVADVIPIKSLSMDFSQRCQLEQVYESEEKEVDDFDSSDDPEDYFSDMWPRRDTVSRPPIICTGYPVNNDQSQRSSSKSSGKSLLKNVFSSLINWRIGKSLPKGSRDYCTTRESLGEEMRAFRCDTMPKLMERAAVNSRLPDLFRKRTSERPRRETQDFAKIIKRPTIDKLNERSNPQSIATIHPVYGSSKASQLNLQARERLYSTSFQRETPRFQTPQVCVATSPPPAPSVAPISSSPDEHLLRPSRLRDLQKRLSHQEMNGNVTAIQLRSSVTYDVPRSNQPVVVQEYSPSTVHYQNIGQTVSDDKRLSCHLFTTF